MTAMMDVPLVGRLNAVFVIAIGFGMFLILTCMVFNIINSVRNHNTEKTWFDSNAVAGLVFYGSIALSAVLLVSGKKLPAAAVLAVMFGIPLLLMFLKEPLTNLVEKKKQILPEQKGMFFVQSFFELFEVLLSYLSNTLSFLRIGAFAVSHAAMMEVVLMLAGATEGGSPNWIIVVLWKSLCMRHGRPDRWYPGSSSGILRDLQSLLCRKRTRISSFQKRECQ